MELVLSLALAAAALVAALGWIRRSEELSRAQRLADELSALRRSASGARAPLEAETGSTPAVGALRFAPEPEEPTAEAWRQERLAEVRRHLDAAEEALAARPRAPQALPLEPLRQEAIDLLGLLERVESSFAALPERAAGLGSERPAPESAPLPPVPASFDIAPVASGLRAADDLADTAGRLKDGLGSLARTTERLREATAASAEALATVARGAEGIGPMAGALSSVANRVNLLALNLAVLVSPGVSGTNVEEAGSELRSIFEEARRLSRDIGALAQRVAAAARTASEQGGALAAAVDEERARVERGVAELGALDDLAHRVRGSLEALRREGRECDEARAQLHAHLEAAVASAAARATEATADRRAAAAFASDVCAACASVTEARLAAERSVRRLLAVAESTAERRAPEPDDAARQAVAEAKKILP